MKIALLIAFKIVEISAIIFVPHYIGKGVKYLMKEDFSDMPCWIAGFIVLLGGFVIILCGSLLVQINWEWAGKLIN